MKKLDLSLSELCDIQSGLYHVESSYMRKRKRPDDMLEAHDKKRADLVRALIMRVGSLITEIEGAPLVEVNSGLELKDNE